MKTFNQFITESKILNEGGNAPFINRETGEILGDAEKIDLKNVMEIQKLSYFLDKISNI